MSEPLHLSYCTNIHPGQTWEEVDNALRSHVPAIKSKLSPREPFGLGLRLSAQAACELESEESFQRLLSLLEELDCYVFTVNGFPFGAFHHTRVKENVYLPDWQSEERLTYTSRLARLLARLAPRMKRSPKRLSISTVPGCFRTALHEGGVALIARQLVRQASFLSRLHRETGTRVVLGLEPEPGCLLETTDELVSFFQEELFSQRRRGDHARCLDVESARVEALLRDHLGICFDTCHAAVQFEDPDEAWNLLQASGIEVAKIQATSALEVERLTQEGRKRLAAFDDGVYLHQGSAKGDGDPVRFIDLPRMLRTEGCLGQHVRVHFHVPVFRRDYGLLSSTQDFLARVLKRQVESPLTDHVEVETYTFGVLPDEFRPASVSEAIAREVLWTREHLDWGAPSGRRK